ncbi:odorant receptor 4-like isoform X2 [Megachile rotundata]|uniref:odorant receptor 4-like isoform X2 n=1 Tax=Megachile rotundata TaxID=143995 RepID=UPI003FD2F709
METLRWTRIMLSVSGSCLQPNAYTPLQKFFYNIYSNMGKIIIYSFFILQVLDIFFNVQNQDEFTENFTLTSMALNVLLKRHMLSTRRTNILSLIKRLDKSHFLPVTKEEMKIRSKFENIIECATKMYATGLAFFAFSVPFISIVIDFKSRKLYARMWVPYNYSSASLYLLTSSYEVVASIYGVSISIACECLYTGLILHVCCQFEILEHRFKTLNGKDTRVVNQCASHHNLIYKFADVINNEFKTVMSFQFFNSTAMICLSIYQLTYAKNSTAFMEIMMYLVCVFLQILFYCLCGNMVKMKSIEFSDNVYSSDWPSWNNSSKMVLLMVIRRSRTPIEFTSMHVVSLSLESFMSLLKTSYSAYNLMKTTR